MSKWRPVPQDCLYVIGDIHGQYHQLKLICNRIFPLRKTAGYNDRLICLGDYIDRGPASPEVVDFLIDAKKKYKNQLILLCGNHELMILDVIKNQPTSHKYLLWMKNGGEYTLKQYLERANEPMDNPYEFPRWRIQDIIPKEHIAFFNSLLKYYETDDYIFVHGGCDPTVPLTAHDIREVAWDRGLFKFACSSVLNGFEMPWKKTIITGHNGISDKPFISEKFMMLDVSYANKLLVVELNSMEAFVAGRNKAKMIKTDLVETKV